MFRSSTLVLLKSKLTARFVLMHLYSTLGAASDLILTDRCVRRLKEVAERGECLRVLVDGGGCSGFEYKVEFDTKENDDDYVFEKNGVKVLVDKVIIDFFMRLS